MTLLKLLAASLLLMAGPAHAQLRVRAGGQLARLTPGRLSTGGKFGTPDDGSGATNGAGLGYEAGLSYQVLIAGRWALVPEVQFSSEHVRVQYYDYRRAPATVVSREYGQRQAYLNVPVLLRASFGRFYVEGGPQASVLLHARQMGTHTNSGYVSTTQDYDRDASDEFYRFDVGGCLGVGVQLPAGLGLNLRAYRGALIVNHDYQAEQADVLPLRYAKAFRQTLQLALTYQLTGRPAPAAR